MKSYVLTLIWALLFSLVSVSGVRAWGEDPVSAGNRAFAAKKYDKALEEYEKAGVAAPESPQLYFNRGTVYYMQGDYDKAREMFEQAALKSKDLALEARSQYNLGNCAFRDAERYADNEPQKAVDALQDAATHYQKALELDPTLADAAHNIEVSRLTLKGLLDKIKQQQEEAAARQKQQQQNQDSLKDLLQKQQQVAQETKDLAKTKQQDPSQDVSRQSQDLADRQEQLQEGTKGLAEKMAAQQAGQQQPDPASQQAQEHLGEAAKQQEKASDRLRKQQTESAQQAQQQAIEELRKAMRAGQQGDNSQQGQQQQKEGQQKQGEQQKQGGDQDRQGSQKRSRAEDEAQQQDQEGQKNEAAQERQQARPSVPRNETARGILEQEKQNREERQRGQRYGSQPVARDW